MRHRVYCGRKGAVPMNYSRRSNTGGHDEYLAAVGVLSRVCHGEKTWGVMPQLEVLVLEGSRAVYGGDARAVVVDEVSALDHEVLDDAVEGGPLVPLRNSVPPVLARAKLTEILCSLRTNI